MLTHQRRIDELGRIVVPSDFRQALGVKAGDSLALTYDADHDTLLMRKAVACCVICRAEEKLHAVHGKFVCESCIRLAGV